LLAQDIGHNFFVMQITRFLALGVRKNFRNLGQFIIAMSQALRHHLEKIIPLTDQEFDYILSHFQLKKFRKHQFVVQEGNTVDYDYFVIRGLLKAYYANEEGKEHILQFAMENWWVTDYQAYTTRSKATLNIDCIENGELLAISFDNKQRLCTEYHKMEHFFRIKTTSGYVGLQQRVLSLLNSDAQSRYQQLFSQYPSLFQRVPKAVIASYLGVSRETLSRMSLE
jgi:CRP-like cAMP-binding protein